MINTAVSLILAGIIETQPQCIRWTWKGTWPNYTVICLEWKKPPAKPK